MREKPTLVRDPAASPREKPTVVDVPRTTESGIVVRVRESERQRAETQARFEPFDTLFAESFEEARYDQARGLYSYAPPTPPAPPPAPAVSVIPVVYERPRAVVTFETTRRPTPAPAREASPHPGPRPWPIATRHYLAVFLFSVVFATPMTPELRLRMSRVEAAIAQAALSVAAIATDLGHRIAR